MSLTTRLSSKRARLALVSAAIFAAAAAVATPGVAATPKAGGSCTKAQWHKTSGTLWCIRNNAGKYVWAKKTTTTSSSSSSSSSSSASTASASTSSTSSVSLDLVNLVFGTAPTAASTKLDVECDGTTTGAKNKQTATFVAVGGTNQATFTINEPGGSNPTGSLCTATATVSGAVPTALQLLVGGRSVAGPVAAASLSTPQFAATGAPAVTVILVYGTGTAAPATIAPTATSTTLVGSPITTIPGVTTTTFPGVTIPPPASGRPEIRTAFVGTVPSTVTGVSAKLTCTPAPGQSTNQVQTVTLGTTAALAQVPVTLATGMYCQVEGNLIGSGTAPTARMLLNGVPFSGPTIGGFINSPSIAVTAAFTVTIEYTWPTLGTTTIAGTATTLGLTTTTLGLTTTTRPGATASGTGTVTFLAPTGAIPTAVTGYRVELTCTNVVVGGSSQASYPYTFFFSTGGGALNALPYTLTATSVCSITGATNSTTAVSNGSMTLIVNDTPRATGTAGTATVAGLAAPGPLNIKVSVAY